MWMFKEYAEIQLSQLHGRLLASYRHCRKDINSLEVLRQANQGAQDDLSPSDSTKAQQMRRVDTENTSALRTH